MLACKSNTLRLSAPSHRMFNGAAGRVVGILLQHLRVARVAAWRKRKYAGGEAVVQAAAAMNRLPVSFLGYNPEFILAGFGSDLSEMGAIPTVRKSRDARYWRR